MRGRRVKRWKNKEAWTLPGQPGVHLRPDPRGRAYRKADWCGITEKENCRVLQV